MDFVWFVFLNVKQLALQQWEALLLINTGDRKTETWERTLIEVGFSPHQMATLNV